MKDKKGGGKEKQGSAEMGGGAQRETARESERWRNAITLISAPLKAATVNS